MFFGACSSVIENICCYLLCVFNSRRKLFTDARGFYHFEFTMAYGPVPVNRKVKLTLLWWFTQLFKSNCFDDDVLYELTNTSISNLDTEGEAWKIEYIDYVLFSPKREIMKITVFMQIQITKASKLNKGQSVSVMKQRSGLFSHARHMLALILLRSYHAI